MSIITTADVRKMVDDLDDILRAAVIRGDVSEVFKRERGTMDKIMRAKKENKNNADVYQEFGVARYFWKFAERWVQAKKEGRLEMFWKAERERLGRYDEENPTGRRQLQPSPPSPIPAPASPKKAVPITTHPLSAPKRPLPGRPKSTSVQPTATGASTGDQPKPVKARNDLPKPSHPMPSKDKPTGGQMKEPQPDKSQITAKQPGKHVLPAVKSRPAAPVRPSNPRPRTPTPVAGPSKPRTRAPSPTPSLSANQPYVPHRIQWKPPRVEVVPQPSKAVGPQTSEVAADESDNDSDEYKPSSVIVKPNKGKGKARERPRKEEGERPKKVEKEEKEKKPRRQPESTGVLRDPPCMPCMNKKIDCYHQNLGTACIGCAVLKIRCDDVEEGTKKTMIKAPTKRTKRAAAPRHARPPRFQRFDANVIPPTFVRSQSIEQALNTGSKRPASRSPSPAPMAKRQRMSDNATGHDASIEQRLEELRGEVHRQRLIIDALLPGYIRQKDQIVELEKQKAEMRGTLEEFRNRFVEMEKDSEFTAGRIHVHQKTIRSHYTKIKYLAEQMDDMDNRVANIHDRVTGLERGEHPLERDRSLEIVDPPRPVNVKVVPQVGRGNPADVERVEGNPADVERVEGRPNQRPLIDEDGIEIIERPDDWVEPPVRDWNALLGDFDVIDIDTGLPLEKEPDENHGEYKEPDPLFTLKEAYDSTDSDDSDEEALEHIESPNNTGDIPENATQFPPQPSLVEEPASMHVEESPNEAHSPLSPPPPSPLSPPPPSPPSPSPLSLPLASELQGEMGPPPPSNTPAVTVQAPTPHTSQDAETTHPATQLLVPATSNPTDSHEGRSRQDSSTSNGEESEPRRSPRLHSRSPSPLPPSLLPRKRRAEPSGSQTTAKKGRRA